MCPAGLQGAVRTRQLQQLTQSADVDVVCWTLFSVTNITTSRVEQHFKATRRVVGELLKVNTDN